MSEEMDKNKNLFSQAFPENGDNRDVIEDTLGCLLGRLSLLDSVVNQRCNQMKERLQQILNFQVRLCQKCLSILQPRSIINRMPHWGVMYPALLFFKGTMKIKSFAEKLGDWTQGSKSEEFYTPRNGGWENQPTKLRAKWDLKLNQ